MVKYSLGKAELMRLAGASPAALTGHIFITALPLLRRKAPR